MQKLPLIIVLEYGLNVMWTKWKLKYLEHAEEITKSKKKKKTKIETRERNVIEWMQCFFLHHFKYRAIMHEL